MRLSRHTPVLLKETLEFLKVTPGEAYLDATVGGGGHSEAILKKGGVVFGLDQDPQQLEIAKRRLEKACPAGVWQLKRGNFSQLKRLAKAFGQTAFAGILFDLGLCSDQLADAQRGFSFQEDGPLDMRMDPSLAVTAADLVNGLSKGELNVLFKRLGEEQLALAVADRIVRTRRRKPIKTTLQLARLVVDVYAQHRRKTKIHPATKVFQALRIAVNDELNALREALPQAVELLKPGGRLVVLSFHGLEDRIVKNFFKQEAREGRLKILTKKPVVPSPQEVEQNPRSRSAKLRCSEKL